MVYLLDTALRLQDTTPIPVQYNTGFAYNHPLQVNSNPSDPCHGFNLDPNTGNLTFKATASSIGPINVLVNERAANDPRFLNRASWLDIREWKERSQAFQDISFWSDMTGRNYLEGKSSALEVGGYEVSSGLFPLLGVRPMLGRGFDAIQ